MYDDENKGMRIALYFREEKGRSEDGQGDRCRHQKKPIIVARIELLTSALFPIELHASFALHVCLFVCLHHMWWMTLSLMPYNSQSASVILSYSCLIYSKNILSISLRLSTRYLLLVYASFYLLIRTMRLTQDESILEIFSRICAISD